MEMRISLGNRLTAGWHGSSLTCISSILGTPRDDWESLPAMKKSDSSLSAGAGEFVDEEERESGVTDWAAMISIEGAAGLIMDCRRVRSIEQTVGRPVEGVGGVFGLRKGERSRVPDGENGGQRR